jgi:hypothetical protein
MCFLAMIPLALMSCSKASPEPPIDRFDPAATGAKVPQALVPTDPSRFDTRYLDKTGLDRKRLTRTEVVSLLSSGIQMKSINSIPNGWNGIQYFAPNGGWRGTRPMSGGDFIGRYVIRNDGAYCWIEPEHEDMTNCYIIEQDSIKRYYIINVNSTMFFGRDKFQVYSVDVQTWKVGT